MSRLRSALMLGAAATRSTARRLRAPLRIAPGGQHSRRHRAPAPLPRLRWRAGIHERTAGDGRLLRYTPLQASARPLKFAAPMPALLTPAGWVPGSSRERCVVGWNVPLRYCASFSLYR